MPGCSFAAFRFCCPTGCVYESDNFDRFDNTDLGAKWTETAGDWSIDTNRLKIVATANAKVTCTTLAPAGSLKYIVSVSVTLGTDGDVARVFVDDSAFFAELERITSTCGRLRLYDDNGGSPICKGSVGVSLGGYTRLVVCVEGAKIHVGTGGSPMLTVPATPASSIVALGTGACTGTIYFEDFSLSKHADDDATCPACGSEGCTWFSDTGCASGSLSATDYTKTGTWAYATAAVTGFTGPAVECTASGYLETLPTFPLASLKTSFTWQVNYALLSSNPTATIRFTLQEGTAYAELSYASPNYVVKLYSGGIAYGLTKTWDPTYSNKNVYVTLCYDGTNVIAYVDDDAFGLGTVMAAPATLTAIVPRITVANLSTGSVLVRTLGNKHPDDVASCPPCATPCETCLPGTFPNTVRVVIANMTSHDYGCTCTDFTITLTATTIATPTLCRWENTGVMGPCSPFPYVATAIVTAVTGGYKLAVLVNAGFGEYARAVFEITVLGGLPDCMTAFDGDVPRVSSSGSLHCTMEVATCTFTSPAP